GGHAMSFTANLSPGSDTSMPGAERCPAGTDVVWAAFTNRVAPPFRASIFVRLEKAPLLPTERVVLVDVESTTGRRWMLALTGHPGWGCAIEGTSYGTSGEVKSIYNGSGPPRWIRDGIRWFFARIEVEADGEWNWGITPV